MPTRVRPGFTHAALLALSEDMRNKAQNGIKCTLEWNIYAYIRRTRHRSVCQQLHVGHCYMKGFVTCERDDELTRGGHDDPAVAQWLF